METYSMVLILELNDEIYEEIYILVSAMTNTPYSLEGYGVSSTWIAIWTREDQYGVCLSTIRRILMKRPIRRIISAYTPYTRSQRIFWII